MIKDALIKYLKTQSITRDKIIVDVIDINEIEGHGWDYTLVFRYIQSPFEENQHLTHQFVSKGTYKFFEDDYLKNEDRRNQKMEEFKAAKQAMETARKEYEDFMEQNSVERHPQAPMEFGMFINAVNNPPEVAMREFQLTGDNIQEYRRLQTNLTTTQEAVRRIGAELTQI